MIADGNHDNVEVRQKFSHLPVGGGGKFPAMQS